MLFIDIISQHDRSISKSQEAIIRYTYLTQDFTVRNEDLRFKLYFLNLLFDSCHTGNAIQICNTHLSSKAHSYTYKHTHIISQAPTRNKYTLDIHEIKVKTRVPPWHGKAQTFTCKNRCIQFLPCYIVEDITVSRYLSTRANAL